MAKKRTADCRGIAAFRLGRLANEFRFETLQAIALLAPKHRDVTETCDARINRSSVLLAEIRKHATDIKDLSGFQPRLDDCRAELFDVLADSEPLKRAMQVAWHVCNSEKLHPWAQVLDEAIESCLSDTDLAIDHTLLRMLTPPSKRHVYRGTVQSGKKPLPSETELAFRVGILIDRLIRPRHVIREMVAHQKMRSTNLAVWLKRIEKAKRLRINRDFEKLSRQKISMADCPKIIRCIEPGDMPFFNDWSRHLLELLTPYPWVEDVSDRLKGINSRAQYSGGSTPFVPRPSESTKSGRLQIAADLAKLIETHLAKTWRPSNEDRDEWLYREWHNGRSHNELIRGIDERGWAAIRTAAGINRAIRRYAKSRGLLVTRSPRGRKPKRGRKRK